MTTIPHILIVEDEKEIANIEKLSLEGLDLNIHHVRYPSKALDYLAEHQPDLLILDIGLPQMNGWELLERIKADNLLKDGVFIIITSGYSDPASHVVEKLEIVCHYLSKPFSPMDFKARVVELLSLES